VKLATLRSMAFIDKNEQLANRWARLLFDLFDERVEIRPSFRIYV
jgi:hypothetical protein